MSKISTLNDSAVVWMQEGRTGALPRARILTIMKSVVRPGWEQLLGKLGEIESAQEVVQAVEIV